MCKDFNDFRPLNGSGTLNDQQLLWLYVMRSAERMDEVKSMCDNCRADLELGVSKPHKCVSCGKDVNNYGDPEREVKLKVIIEQRRRRMEMMKKTQEEARARIEAELEAQMIGGEEQDEPNQEG